MLLVCQVREGKGVPAVTHVDGSARLQTVTRTDNPLYYKLIKTFEDLTGVPIVLNTSFNENEPIVCAPEEALACFLRTRMDLLVLGRTVIQRTEQKRSTGSVNSSTADPAEEIEMSMASGARSPAST